jgi:hypothetical protein
LKARLSDNSDVGNQEILAIAGALRENKGLVELHFVSEIIRVSDETWDAVCDSLKTHPTLEVLNPSASFRDAKMAPAVITFRIQALVDMLKVNNSIHTIHVSDRYTEHELFLESVAPYLKANLFESNRLQPCVRD